MSRARRIIRDMMWGLSFSSVAVGAYGAAMDETDLLVTGALVLGGIGTMGYLVFTGAVKYAVMWLADPKAAKKRLNVAFPAARITIIAISAAALSMLLLSGAKTVDGMGGPERILSIIDQTLPETVFTDSAPEDKLQPAGIALEAPDLKGPE